MSTTISQFLTRENVTDNVDETVLIQLLDDPVTPTGNLNVYRLDEFVKQTNGEIQSRLGDRYRLPLEIDDDLAETVRATLLRYALSICLYLIRSAPPREASKEDRQKYEDAIEWLETVRKGEATLGISTRLPGAEAKEGGVLSSLDKDRVFGKTRP